MNVLIYRVFATIIAIGSIPIGVILGLTFSVRFDSALPLWAGMSGGVLMLLFAVHIFEQANKKAKPAQRIRWKVSATSVETGVVIREYEDKLLGAFALSEPHLEIQMDFDGRILRFPKGAFVLRGDGVLEYKY